jgi:hypothetical protein
MIAAVIFSLALTGMVSAANKGAGRLTAVAAMRESSKKRRRVRERMVGKSYEVRSAGLAVLSK